MKRYTLYIIVAILGMLNIQPAEAQQKNDQNALYIFRNDGGFNAFFFADIERIEYSKIDTLGHEQSDYVVQEIYAMDSIFRIPVSAIDSVAFVTPKNKVKEDVVCPDKTMTDYIVASDSVSWFRLSASAPSSIIPKVGDKLLIENPVKYLPDGFSGKVTKVSNGSDGTTIETDPLALEDLFDRFIAKAAAGSNASVAAGTRGLINGISDEYVNQDVIELPVLSGSFSPATFSGDAFKAFNDNFAISLEGTASGSYTLTPKITDFRAFIYADISEGVKYSQYIKMDNEAQIALTASGTIGANLDIPLEFGADKIDGILKNNRRTYAKNFGLFCVDFSYGWFFNGKGSVNSSISYGLKGESLSTVSYDEPFFHIPVKEDFKVNMSSNCSDGEWEVDGWGYGLSVSTGIYAKAEAKIRFLGRTWQTEARAEAGVRFEENTSVEPAEAGGTEILETPALYTKAFANDNVTRAYYGGIQLSVKKGIGMGVDYSIFNYSNELTFGKRELFYSVPDMKSIKWEVDNKAPWRGTLTVPLEKELLFPKQVGLAVFDVTDAEKPQQVVNYWKTGSYINNKAYSQIKEVVETLEPSKQYTAYPQVKLYNYPILADKQVNVALGAPMMDIKPKAVEFDENPGYKDIEVITNVKNTEFTTEDAWLNETKPTWNNEEGRLTVHAPALPDGTDTRKGYVIGVGYDKDGKELLRDTVTITQLRSILQASPNPVTFEQKGGTVKVTLNTTLAQIEAQIQEGGNLDKFFTMTLNADNTITVTAPENTTGQELSGNIIVKGTSPGGQKAELNLNVIQKGDGGEQSQYWLKISPEEYSFDVNGGTARFIVTDNVPIELINDFVWTASIEYRGEKWFDNKWDGDDYLLTAMANTTGEERSATITFKLTSEKYNVYAEKVVSVTQATESGEWDYDFFSSLTLSIDFPWESMYGDMWSEKYAGDDGFYSYYNPKNYTWTSDNTVSKCEIKVNQMNNKLLVSASYYYKWQAENVIIDERNVSFTIEKVNSNNYEGAIIKDLKVNNHYYYKGDPNDFFTQDNWKDHTYTFTASNIPYVTKGEEIIFNGTVGSGVTDFNATWDEKGYNSTAPYDDHFEAKNDPRNRVYISMKPKNASTRTENNEMKTRAGTQAMTRHTIEQRRK